MVLKYLPWLPFLSDAQLKLACLFSIEQYMTCWSTKLCFASFLKQVLAFTFCCILYMCAVCVREEILLPSQSYAKIRDKWLWFVPVTFGSDVTSGHLQIWSPQIWGHRYLNATSTALEWSLETLPPQKKTTTKQWTNPTEAELWLELKAF